MPDPIKFPVEFFQFSARLYFAPALFLWQVPILYLGFLKDRGYLE